ncbi:MAG: hypothetical protein ACEQSB_06040 [Undibacterium sp.]
MSGMSLADADGANDPIRAQHLKRRKLDTEMFMLQSDRSKFERQSNELDAEIRTLEKQRMEKELEIDMLQGKRSRLIQKVQDIDAEILRAKRSAYKK